jgi:MFS family permease
MKVNNLIKILTFSDVVVLSGWELMNPVFAVFLTDQIVGGNLELVGLASSVYLIIRALLQLPFARFIDRRRGEIDDFIVMALGSFIISLVPFLYVFARSPLQVLIFQGFLGLGAAMVAPSWLAIFTRHIDKSVEAEEWGLYNSMVGIGGALAGALSGFMAERIGFQYLFVLVGIISVFGTSFLFFVYQDLRRQEKRVGLRGTA